MNYFLLCLAYFLFVIGKSRVEFKKRLRTTADYMYFQGKTQLHDHVLFYKVYIPSAYKHRLLNISVSLVDNVLDMCNKFAFYTKFMCSKVLNKYK